jgi:parallel beta-helix repeat protein
MSRLTPGQAGCLAGGQTFTEAARIEISGTPGRPVRLQGNGATLRGGIAVRSNDVVVAGVRIRGLGERRRGVVVVQGARVSILRNEIVGRDIVRWTPCVLLDGAAGTTIDGNVISQCTRATSRSVHAQGIFVVNSTATTIANNVVTRTSGEGIAFTRSRGAVVVRNHVHANTNGVYLGPDTTEVLVADNVISYSGRHNVHGGGGFGNLVTGNCLWRGFGGSVSGGGFVATGNRVTSPRYVNRFRSLAMRRGPCARLRPLSRRSAGRSVGTPFPVMPRFLVHYRLLGLPRRVKVVRLFLTRVLPGTSVSVRCVRRCRGSGRTAAAGGGKAVIPTLHGRWLARGAVVEIRAARPGWGGHVARVRVVGAPRGVVVGHSCTPAGSRTRVSCTRLQRR